ncbi:hypothetical protein JCM11957_02210 [Caminibacter profundus]
MLNKIKTLNSFISTSIIFFLSFILVIILVNQLTISNHLKKYTKYDSFLINKFGQIRGNIQRYTKLKIAHSQKIHKVSKNIDNLFITINYYLDNYPEIVPDKYLIKFYDLFSTTNSLWKQIKNTNSEKKLLVLSEKAWQTADKLTCLMKHIAEDKMAYIINKIFLFTFISITLIVILILIVYSLVRSGLEKATITDPLTTLYNRLYFENQIKYLHEKYKRNKTPFSIFLFDIDNFKKINDTYGHQTGDEVLTSIAKILKTNLRKTDLPCRYGGEEFIVIFPESRLQDIITVAKRIKQEIAKNIILDDNLVTISGGVGEYSNNYNSVDEFLNRIDAALYIAKKSGKNKIITV